MKRLLVALILAVVLTLTLATPAFAGPPEDKPGPGNMPDEGIAGLQKALPNISWCLPGGFSLTHRQVIPPAFHPYGSCLARLYVLRATLQGCPPGQTVP